MDHATLQSVGQSGLSKNLRQPEKPQEEGHHSRRAQAAGPLLGDAGARNALEWSGAGGVRSRLSLINNDVIPGTGSHPLRLGAAFSSVNSLSSKLDSENEHAAVARTPETTLNVRLPRGKDMQTASATRIVD